MLISLQKNTNVEKSLRLQKLINGAYWLVKLRWLAIAGVISVPVIAINLFGMQVEYKFLLSVAAGLVVENILVLLILQLQKKRDIFNSINSFKLILNFQIALDLIFLTVILHFTGGIENLFYIFYLFHLVISSMLLSKRNSYFFCFMALLFLCIISYAEYKGFIDHHHLWHQQTDSFHSIKNPGFLVQTILIFGFTSFIIVYMTNAIVSILRKQENELHAYNDQLLRKDTIKNEYVLRLTHDIKGHLAAIQINLSLMIDKMIGGLNNKQEEALNNVYNRTVRLSDFVNRLLNLTYMRLNKKIELEIFLVHEAVENAISLIQGIAEEKSLCLRYHVDKSLDTITNNKFAFEELISSLVLNAIRYTKDCGKIDVVVKDKNESILIEISDTGIGIPSDEIDLIFDEFYRASNARAYKPHGTGLGLAIVKQIVNLYQGDIWVESKLNIGTTFFVQFSKNISDVIQLKGN